MELHLLQNMTKLFANSDHAVAGNWSKILCVARTAGLFLIQFNYIEKFIPFA